VKQTAKLQEHKIGDSIPFLGAWYIDSSICDGLIDYYNESPLKEPGRTLHKTSSIVNTSLVKKSTDVRCEINSQDKRISSYISALLDVVDCYKSRFPALDDNLSMWGLTEPFNIQRYEPNEGFVQWHCERSSLMVANRLLVFMTYLNDVNDGGGTEWKYLNLHMQPEKGLTAIWCADWIHLHRGVTSPTELKMIATGWFGLAE